MRALFLRDSCSWLFRPPLLKVTRHIYPIVAVIVGRSGPPLHPDGRSPMCPETQSADSRAIPGGLEAVHEFMRRAFHHRVK